MNKTRTLTWIAVGLLGLALVVAPGCYGKFNLTRQVYAFNTNLGSKWVNEVVFIILGPVYGFTVAGDSLILNSVEFWGADNPVNEPAVAIKGPRDIEG
ncbi:MAG: DUF3332 family protein [Planctomycetes bacterium]|nr:DUF3332 family protein [Planctomycetota bacterium]